MSTEILVGRQAIFDRDLKIVAYELLFRDVRSGKRADFRDADDATSRVIDNTLYGIGFRNLVGELPAFINVTRGLLLAGDPLPLRKDEVILEVLEDIEVDEVLLARLRTLSASGYAIALDDFFYDPRHKPLIDIADIIKVDIGLVPAAVLPQHVRELKGHDVKLLAEKIETAEQMDRCRALDFDMFQGYFLAEPDTVTLVGPTTAPGNRPDPTARRRR
ncbi:MAG: EAL and HDOD domain-containing protein [Chromatiales bacterium]